MKKIISVLLVFASIAAIFSVSGFAFNDILADANTFVDNTLGETVAELGAAAGEIFGKIILPHSGHRSIRSTASWTVLLPQQPQ